MKKQKEYSDTILDNRIYLPIIGVFRDAFYMPYYRFDTHVRYTLVRADGKGIIASVVSLN